MVSQPTLSQLSSDAASRAPRMSQNKWSNAAGLTGMLNSVLSEGESEWSKVGSIADYISGVRYNKATADYNSGKTDIAPGEYKAPSETINALGAIAEGNGAGKMSGVATLAGNAPAAGAFNVMSKMASGDPKQAAMAMAQMGITAVNPAAGMLFGMIADKAAPAIPQQFQQPASSNQDKQHNIRDERIKQLKKDNEMIATTTNNNNGSNFVNNVTSNLFGGSLI